MVYNPFVIVEIWERDNSAVIAELPRRWDVQMNDPLNISGVGQVAVDFNDPVLDRNPGILGRGNWVKFWMGDGLGNGQYVGAFQIRRRRLRYIGEGDWLDQYYVLSGPQVHGIAIDVMVKHETQPPRQDASETRSYSWTSKEGPWYDPAEWATTIFSHGTWDSHITRARSGRTAKPDYKPNDWPDPNAEWIRATGGAEWQFFRRTYTAPAGGLLVKLFLTADEICAAAIDGDFVIKRDEYENGYESYSEYKTFLPEGEHQFAFMMRKKATPGGDGVDAMLVSLMSLKENGKPDAVLFHSNDSAGWKCHNGIPVPGWNQAQIFRSWWSEARDRHTQAWDSAQLIDIHPDFENDSDVNGAPWVIELSRTFRVGTKVPDGQAQLSEIGSFDVWVEIDNTPANFKWKAALARGTDKSASIVLEPGRNLSSWEVEEVDEIVNDATAHYEGGWVEYQASGSITDYGHREIAISLNQVGDDETAEIIASAHIERKKHARKRAGRADEIERDEDRQPVAAIIAVQGATPFLDFGTGDWVKGPSGTGVHARQRLLSLSLAEDNETGNLSFDPEFGVED